MEWDGANGAFHGKDSIKTGGGSNQYHGDGHPGSSYGEQASPRVEHVGIGGVEVDEYGLRKNLLVRESDRHHVHALRRLDNGNRTLGRRAEQLGRAAQTTVRDVVDVVRDVVSA